MSGQVPVPWSEREPSTCKGNRQAEGCGEAIRWVEMPSGKRMPVDAEPSSAGNLAVDEEGNARVVGQGYTGPRYTSHFATCANATAFSRGRS